MPFIGPSEAAQHESLHTMHSQDFTVHMPMSSLSCYKAMYGCTDQDALEEQDLPFTYLPHHELRSARIVFTFLTQGLGDIYEEEFVAATVSGASTAVDKQNAVRQEAKNLMKELFGKLDALSHFHYAPKPVIEEMQVRADVPALAMEEVAPQVGMLAIYCVAAQAYITCSAALCCAVLCCAVLCCAVLCCAALRCALLRSAVLCCALLCCAALCCAALCCAMQLMVIDYVSGISACLHMAL